MGFGGVILHGLCTWNIACRAVLATFADSDGSRLRSFGGRFASPVRPGDLLETRMWRTGPVKREEEDGKADGCLCEEVLFDVIVGEKPVIVNGRALFKVPRGSRL
jgi:peroxisomal enoyl-CoA hydratase 2